MLPLSAGAELDLFSFILHTLAVVSFPKGITVATFILIWSFIMFPFFFTDNGQPDHCIKSSPPYPKDSHVAQVLSLRWPVCVWKRCLMLLEPLFHYVSLINHGIDIW